MSPQLIQTLSHIAIAAGVIIGALGGFGVYYSQKKIEAEKTVEVRPMLDLCRRGIAVTAIPPHSLRFDIPYCAGKNANAYDVRLQNAVIVKDGDGFKVLSGFGDHFPEGVTLSYETGKSMLFTLSPIDANAIPDIYIAVRGTFTNEAGKTRFSIFDVFKCDFGGSNWIRTMGAEDVKIRAFVRLLPYSDRQNADHGVK